MSLNQKNSLLIVDDDPLIVEIIEEMLADCFEIRSVLSGEAALTFVEHTPPDLILLDIEMPGISGYDVCKSIRKSKGQDELGVIFLSAFSEEEQRIECYESGADDFIAKPLAATELRYKIDITLRKLMERRSLKTELNSSFKTAMSAMSTAAEVGAVVNFLRSSFACENYHDLCREVITALDGYDLIGAVQIRGKRGVYSLGSSGTCSALEESILNKMFGHSRLFEFSKCLSCNYPHIIVVVRNLDRSDVEKKGRMRDNIAFLVEGANARVEALDKDYELIQKHDALSKLVLNTSQALKEIEALQHKQLEECDQIFIDLQQSFDLRLMSLGLTETQEHELCHLLQEAQERALKLYDQGLSTEAYMERILKQLNSDF